MGDEAELAVQLQFFLQEPKHFVVGATAFSVGDQVLELPLSELEVASAEGLDRAVQQFGGDRLVFVH